MKEKILRKILKDRAALDKLVDLFIKRKLLFKRKSDEFEIAGHMEKAKHNLSFIGDTKKIEYPDWIVTGCYYAVYHAVLSLIMSKGYFSKNHDASLSVLIKEFYEDFVSAFDFINALFIDYNDITFYVQTREKRESASYSSSFVFSKNEIEKIINQTVNFVNKAEEILENGI